MRAQHGCHAISMALQLSLISQDLGWEVEEARTSCDKSKCCSVCETEGPSRSMFQLQPERSVTLELCYHLVGVTLVMKANNDTYVWCSMKDTRGSSHDSDLRVTRPAQT